MMTTPTKPSTRAVAAADGLTKHYGSIAAVVSLSFDVPAEQVTGLLGPNGAGKTTEAGIERPDGDRSQNGRGRDVPTGDDDRAEVEGDGGCGETGPSGSCAQQLEGS